MYLKNLQNITGILPEMMNKPLSIHQTKSKDNSTLNNKGSRLSIAAFLLLSAALLTLGCESSGSVGDGLVSDDDTVERLEFDVEGLETIDIDAFTGRLQNSPLGYSEDLFFGDIQSYFLVKPSIDTTFVDSLREDDTLSLRLLFNQDDVYGDESSVSNFEIYEVNEVWRGNQLRHGADIDINFSEKVGEFQLADEDSIVVPLSKEWTEKLAGFYNSDAADRDSLYVNNFGGLAIVPAEDNRKIRFLRTIIEEEDDELVPSFLLNAPTSVNGNNDDEIGEEEEEEIREIAMRDWGSVINRSNEPTIEDGFILHNKERILRVDFDLSQEELQSKNITNVRLILSVDRQYGTEVAMVRTMTENLRAHAFPTPPRDIMAEIFSRDANFTSILDNSGEFFSLNVTQFVLNDVFGELDAGSIYISLGSIDGRFYSTKFFGNDGPENKKPRLIITSVQ